MLDVNALKAQDLQGLSQRAMVELATEMLAQITAMNALLQARDKQAAEHAQEIKFKDTKLGRITHELARLKAGKFGAKTERMNAGQRQMFEETAAEDEASLQAQLLALQGTSEQSTSPPAGTRCVFRSLLHSGHEPSWTAGTAGAGQSVRLSWSFPNRGREHLCSFVQSPSWVIQGAGATS